jgi:deoxycytidylate deaminase
LFEEEEDRPIMSKKIKKISNSNDYEKSSFKDIIEDMEDTKNVGLESLPKIRKEQVPSADETSKEILYGDGDKDDEDNNK